MVIINNLEFKTSRDFLHTNPSHFPQLKSFVNPTHLQEAVEFPVSWLRVMTENNEV